MIRNCTILFSLLAAIMMFSSCSDIETYAEKKDKERAAINSYLSTNNVKVISESEFASKGNTTDVTKNEFVLFDSNGIYLQIIRKGCGEPLASGKYSDVYCRFKEYNLLTDSLQLTNDVDYFASIPEKMSVKNTLGTFSGSFDMGSSLMYSCYGSASVPAGWLFPLTYINLGKPVKDDDEIAKVKIIVPSAQGQSNASMNVYPCLYEITYQK